MSYCDGDDPSATAPGFPLPAVGIMAMGFVLVIAVALIAAAASRLRRPTIRPPAPESGRGIWRTATLPAVCFDHGPGPEGDASARVAPPRARLP